MFADFSRGQAFVVTPRSTQTDLGGCHIDGAFASWAK